MTETYDKLDVYTDGGSRGNPGPAALGVAFYSKDGQIVAKFSEYLGEQTNNYAEYSAILFALKKAKEMGVRQLDCYMDSELAVKQIGGLYRVKSKGLRPIFDEVQRLACNFENVTFQHVRREKNTIADSLVNEALDKRA